MFSLADCFTLLLQFFTSFTNTHSLCSSFHSAFRPPGTPREIPGCFGGCDETVCGACYNSVVPLLLPDLMSSCPTTCGVNSDGVISDPCLQKWGKCVNEGCKKTYGKVDYCSLADFPHYRFVRTFWLNLVGLIIQTILNSFA